MVNLFQFHDNCARRVYSSSKEPTSPLLVSRDSLDGVREIVHGGSTLTVRNEIELEKESVTRGRFFTWMASDRTAARERGGIKRDRDAQRGKLVRR